MKIKMYKLKKWYPSLVSSWRVGDVIIIKENDYKYYAPAWGIDNSPRVPAKEVEDNPDHWVEIRNIEPMFITYDGVRMVDFEYKTWAVDVDTFKKVGYGFRDNLHPTYIYFAHEENADKFIVKFQY